MADKLAVCPCGQIPEKLTVESALYSNTWATVRGNCCYDGQIEFHKNFSVVGSEENIRRAREAWNDAPRGKGNELLADDLVSLLRRVAHSLRKAEPNNDLAERALDYLKRHGQAGSVLRGTDDGVK